jgi:inner membrane protein
MSPVTHFFAGWLVASATTVPLTRREKILVVAAAIAPDLDGLGLIPELLTRNSAHPLLWFSLYHHSLHTLAFALICALAAFFIDRNGSGGVDCKQPAAARPWLTAGLVFISFHLHLLCDLLGARGPEGYQWPIPYLKPFSNSMELTWHGQWALNGWQNFAFTALLLLTTLWLAWRKGISPVELASPAGNEAFVLALRQRFWLRRASERQ